VVCGECVITDLKSLFRCHLTVCGTLPGLVVGQYLGWLNGTVPGLVVGQYLGWLNGTVPGLVVGQYLDC